MKDSSRLKTHKAHRTLLMISMFSIIMLFAGLTSAYIVSKGALGSNWDIITLPIMFYISTAMIIISSFFGHNAVKACKKDDFEMIKKSLLGAILFGFLFSFFQFLGWKELVDAGKFLSGNNVASSYMYILTAVHLLHLLGGLISLIFVWFKSFNKNYDSKNYNGLMLSIRFWHFLAILWFYIMLFLLIIN